MKGKILGLGVISGDDGKRYSFELSDISNLGERNPQNLAGCEVDFEAGEDGKAKGIFITGGSFNANLGELQGKLMATDTKGIRFKFLLSLGLVIGGSMISAIPLLGWVIGPICMVAGFVFLILAVIGASRASESKTLLKNFILSVVIAVVSCVIAFAIGGTALLSAAGGYDAGGGVAAIVAGLIFFVGLIAAFVFQLLYTRELAFVTDQKILLWAMYVNILGALTSLIFIGYVLVLAALIMQIIGFMKFQKIRKRSENDVMPWF